MKNWLLLFIIGCMSAYASYPNFDHNPLLTSKMKTLIEPHLLPLDHPLKPALDKIFDSLRVCQSKQNILQAGFTILAEMPKSLTFVVRHPDLPGHVMKIHLDQEKKGRLGTPSWEWLTLRCSQAKKIKQLTHQHKMTDFSVPDKWLYPLPQNASPEISNPQVIVLLATDMDLVSHEECQRAWKTVPTKKTLQDLYIILKSGYGSSGLPWNIPYTKNGTFAFVDTERPMDKFRKVDRYFSKEMQAYWRTIPFDHDTPKSLVREDSIILRWLERLPSY